MDAKQINQTFDLLGYLGGHTLTAKGAWHIGACPVCGGKDRFNLKHTREGWRWFCRKCSGEKYNGPIDMVMALENLDFKAALARMGGDSNRPAPAPAPPPPPVAAVPVMDMQEQAHAAMRECERILHSPTGERARAWLEKRGIRQADMLAWNLGFSTGIRVGGLSIEPGIVIPCYERGDIWYIKVRRRDNAPKYRKVAGLQAPGLFGSCTALGARHVFVTEGEFDAALLWRYAADMDEIGVVTTGGASDSLDIATWGECLLSAERIFAAYDMDEAGERAFAKLALITQPERIVRATLPTGKDITDFWQSGGDLAAWISFYTNQPILGA